MDHLPELTQYANRTRVVNNTSESPVLVVRLMGKSFEPARDVIYIREGWMFFTKPLRTALFKNFLE